MVELESSVERKERVTDVLLILAASMRVPPSPGEGAPGSGPAPSRWWIHAPMWPRPQISRGLSKLRHQIHALLQQSPVKKIKNNIERRDWNEESCEREE
jgi:hypothetical protein